MVMSTFWDWFPNCIKITTCLLQVPFSPHCLQLVRAKSIAGREGKGSRWHEFFRRNLWQPECVCHEWRELMFCKGLISGPFIGMVIRWRYEKAVVIPVKLKNTVTSLRRIWKAATNSHIFIALINGAMPFMNVLPDEFVLVCEVNCTNLCSPFFSFLFSFLFVCLFLYMTLVLLPHLSRELQVLMTFKHTCFMLVGNQW